jgi:hypothetical protein
MVEGSTMPFFGGRKERSILKHFARFLPPDRGVSGNPATGWSPSMKGMTDAAPNQVHKVDAGQFIAFWRGQVVHTLGGALRHFASEQEAWDFLARRESVSGSMLGAGSRPTPRAKLTPSD